MIGIVSDVALCVLLTQTLLCSLTNPKLYTGAHKNRFSEDGQGKGLEGRDRPKGDVIESFRKKGASPAKKALTPSKYESSPIFDRLTTTTTKSRKLIFVFWLAHAHRVATGALKQDNGGDSTDTSSSATPNSGAQTPVSKQKSVAKKAAPESKPAESAAPAVAEPTAAPVEQPTTSVEVVPASVTSSDATSGEATTVEVPS